MEHVAQASRLRSARKPSFQLRVTREPDLATLALSGRLTLRCGTQIWSQLQRFKATRGQRVQLDLSEVAQVDGCAIALLVAYRAQLRQAGVECAFVDAEGPAKELIKLYDRNVTASRRRRRRPQGLLDQLGAATIRTLVELQLVLAFFGQLVWGLVLTFKAPRTLNWGEVTPTMERAGADAVPIVALINFLLGLVMGMQSATQLKRFGADIFLADLIGISVTREIGPLMTAIIVCGRTGSAIAAELGTMKTNEEIDALRTMGFGTMRFLVMPRMLALMLVMPMLTLVADLCGGLGGLVIGVYRLDLTTSAYLTETLRAVKMWHITSGLWKSVGFAAAIALISCQQGLATTGGAEGVGRRTTSAVVTTLFSLIVIDVVFTAFFEAVRAG